MPACPKLQSLSAPLSSEVLRGRQVPPDGYTYPVVPPTLAHTRSLCTMGRNQLEITTTVA